MSDQRPERVSDTPSKRPAIIGDVVFGGADSPVAVCTLASRSMLAALAGRPEIAIAGRVYTENVGVERMVQNLAAFEAVRFLIVCGRETRHGVGRTILALHRSGLDGEGRVVGSDAPEAVMPNLTADQLRAFQERVTVVDMIGTVDAQVVVRRAAQLARSPGTAPAAVRPTAGAADASVSVEHVVATRDRTDAWVFDPVGYFLIFVDRARRLLRAEQYTAGHRLTRIVEGSTAEAICHTIVRLGQVTLPAHAAYLGRELAKAEAALGLGLEYEQDRPLMTPSRQGMQPQPDIEEEDGGDRAGNRRAP